MTTVDLSTQALERLLALDAQRTPGYTDGYEPHDSTSLPAVAVVDLTVPLAREVLRLRKELGYLSKP